MKLLNFAVTRRIFLTAVIATLAMIVVMLKVLTSRNSASSLLLVVPQLHIFFNVDRQLASSTPLSETFAKRRQRHFVQCLQNYDTLPGHPKTRVPAQNADAILVNHEHNVLFCGIPKAASTNWRRFFVQWLTGDLTLPFSEEKLHDISAMLPYLKPLQYGTKESLDELLKKTKHYTKIMWVREPIQRLVSAWRSKFAIKNDYYWNVFGSYIVDKFRKNSTRSWNDTGDDAVVTLDEFFQFLVSPILYRDDVHWAKMHKLCLSCLIDYDYIGHLEGGNEEANFVIEKVTGQQAIEFPEAPPKNHTTVSTEDLLRTIPPGLLKKIIYKYGNDFAIFGYPTCNYLSA